MKILSFPNVYLVCTLALILVILFVVWHVTAPQVIAGEDLVGTWPPCDGITRVKCPGVDERECTDYRYKCTSGDEGDCNKKATHSSCMSTVDCQSLWHEACN